MYPKTPKKLLHLSAGVMINLIFFLYNFLHIQTFSTVNMYFFHNCIFENKKSTNYYLAPVSGNDTWNTKEEINSTKHPFLRTFPVLLIIWQLFAR